MCFRCGNYHFATLGLPEKPVITNKEGKVDKEFILTWAQPEADSSDLSPSYHLEWREKLPTGFLEKQEHGSIVETYFKISGLEYESEYEVKLFAVNKQGESEPDVRTFKTKTGMYLHLICRASDGRCFKFTTLMGKKLNISLLLRVQKGSSFVRDFLQNFMPAVVGH